MRLSEWVDAESKTRNLSRRDVLAKLAVDSGVSMMTLVPVDRGAQMGLYKKAKAVSVATGHQVTIPELCE